jgi:hypothetical protein
MFNGKNMSRSIEKPDIRKKIIDIVSGWSL